MKVMEVREPAEIEREPLRIATRNRPAVGPGDLLLRVIVCGVCHTDLHIAEGDLEPPSFPVVPGHQVVGEVVEVGEGTAGWKAGQRAGVPWLFSTCGVCEFCRSGLENLCRSARFTGLDAQGGFAEFMIARSEYALHLPEQIEDLEAAPLLCAGIIGYRSLRLSEIRPGGTLGLVGFGSSAHLAIQVARSWGCRVMVFSRTPSHRDHALKLGADWAGSLEQEPPSLLDAAVTFAPVGHLVPDVLRLLKPGGTLAINAVYLTPIPEIEYKWIYGERTLRSVANLTRQDGREFLDLAAKIGLQVTTTTYDLEQANEALRALKHSQVDGSLVLRP